jgi:hypothetical protein
MRRRIDVIREIEERVVRKLTRREPPAGARILSHQRIQADHDAKGKRALPMHARPTNRNECRDAERPCPFVGCRYHLFLDIMATGSIRFNFPGCEPADLIHSCALDIADAGRHDLQDIAVLYGMTRGRAVEILDEAVEKLRTTDYTDFEIEDFDYRE